jgi:HAMP domain-containing protein
MAPWEVRNDTDQGVLGTALVKSFLVSTSKVTRLQITLVVAFTFLLVILIGYYIAKFITQPLMHLVKASSQVAQGNFDVHVPPNTGDSIILTASFNDMVQNLKNLPKELLDACDRTLRLIALVRDEYRPCCSVTGLTVKIARRLGSAKRSSHPAGALLHDIGKWASPMWFYSNPVR